MKLKTISLRARINAFCKHCIYDEHSGAGNWRQQVTGCTAISCPLFAVRPLSKPEKTPKTAPEQTEVTA